jgi:hypothetical protein
MEKIPGRLIVDLLPDATVRLVFLPTREDHDACRVRANGLEAAEKLFMTCGLSVESAAALRTEVSLNKVAMVNIEADQEIAEKFRFPFLTR